jgi:hypothetical protein
VTPHEQVRTWKYEIYRTIDTAFVSLVPVIVSEVGNFLRGVDVLLSASNYKQ